MTDPKVDYISLYNKCDEVNRQIYDKYAFIIKIKVNLLLATILQALTFNNFLILILIYISHQKLLGINKFIADNCNGLS